MMVNCIVVWNSGAARCRYWWSARLYRTMVSQNSAEKLAVALCVTILFKHSRLCWCPRIYHDWLTCASGSALESAAWHPKQREEVSSPSLLLLSSPLTLIDNHSMATATELLDRYEGPPSSSATVAHRKAVDLLSSLSNPKTAQNFTVQAYAAKMFEQMGRFASLLSRTAVTYLEL